MKRTTVSVFLIVGLSVALVWMNRHHNQTIKKLGHEVSQAEKLRDESAVRLVALEREASELRAALKEATAKPKDLVPPVSDVGFENALESWIGKVRRLSVYLKMNPEKRIPQMDLLTDEHWLDVTKGSLETDADFREALGKLRGLARQKIAAEIGSAIKSALSANGGRVPESVQELAPYLPPGFNPEILKQLSPNPSGKIDGLSSLGPAMRFVMVDTPVDLWDATMFYNTEGTYGSRSAMARGQVPIKTAIAKFTEANGSPPNSVSQLLEFPGVGAIDHSEREEIFRALTTKPKF